MRVERDMAGTVTWVVARMSGGLLQGISETAVRIVTVDPFAQELEWSVAKAWD